MKAKERIYRYGLAAYLRSCRKISRPTKRLIKQYQTKYGKDIPITREQAIQREVERRVKEIEAKLKKEYEMKVKMYEAREVIRKQWKKGQPPTREQLEEAQYI